MDLLLGAVVMLLALAVVIAVLGIVNTLALSVFERGRELGLLRAVGMSRRQVRAMVRWESVFISVLGAALALIVGVVIGTKLVVAMAERMESITVQLPVARIGVLIVLGVVVGITAAGLPARRAASTDALEAVRVA